MTDRAATPAESASGRCHHPLPAAYPRHPPSSAFRPSSVPRAPRSPAAPAPSAPAPRQPASLPAPSPHWLPPPRRPPRTTRAPARFRSADQRGTGIADGEQLGLLLAAEMIGMRAEAAFHGHRLAHCAGEAGGRLILQDCDPTNTASTGENTDCAAAFPFSAMARVSRPAIACHRPGMRGSGPCVTPASMPLVAPA